MKYERITDPRFVPGTILMCSDKCRALEIYLRLAELEDKINNGELVDAIWFKSWVNGQICCGSVIGYSDGCFVIACGDDLISANKIYTSREQARYELDKKIDKKEE